MTRFEATNCRREGDLGQKKSAGIDEGLSFSSMKKPIQHSICRVSQQAKTPARTNKHGASGATWLAPRELSTIRGVGVPHNGLQACHIGAVTCFTARRAPSSPHLACGLNGSFFLRTCGLIPAVKAGRSFSFQEGAETCGTLRGWMVCATPMSTHARLNSVGPSGKRLVFFCGGVIGLECTYLLGLRANFDGLTWVRSKVRSL